MFCMFSISPIRSLEHSAKRERVVYSTLRFMRKFTRCIITDLPLSWAPWQHNKTLLFLLLARRIYCTALGLLKPKLVNTLLLLKSKDGFKIPLI